MSAARKPGFMSLDDYQNLTNANPLVRYEYLDGRVVMMIGGSRYHSIISGRIFFALTSALLASGSEVFNTAAKIRLNSERNVYPDITVVCQPNLQENAQAYENPQIVVAVLSSRTSGYDRGDKRAAYQDCPSIDAILLVEKDKASVIVYRRKPNDFWEVEHYGIAGTIVFDTLGISIRVADMYRGLPLG